MKKILLFLAVLAMVSLTACNSNKQPTDSKDIEKEYYKIVMKYAEDNNFNMEGYEEVIFRIVPMYNINRLSVKYDSIFKSRESTFDSLLDNKKSALYEWIRISKYQPLYIYSSFSYAVKNNKKLIDKDIEFLQFFSKMVDDYLKELEQCKDIVRYSIMWVYNTNTNGIKEKNIYELKMPTLNNFNFNAIECEDKCNDSNVQNILSEFKTDDEFVECVETTFVKNGYINTSGCDDLNVLYHAPVELKEENEELKQYLGNL